MPTTDRKGQTTLLPKEALTLGWRYWVVLLVLSSAGLLAVLTMESVSGGSEEGSESLAGAVLVGVSVAWLVLLGSAVLVLRGYCFRALWDGRPVEPGSYLKGMYQVWGVLVLGALLGVLGSLLMGTLLPGGLVVMVAVVALVFARPSGRALGV